MTLESSRPHLCHPMKGRPFFLTHRQLNNSLVLLYGFAILYFSPRVSHKRTPLVWKLAIYLNGIKDVFLNPVTYLPLSSWGSGNYRQSAPFLYEVASHGKQLPFRPLLLLFIIVRKTPQVDYCFKSFMNACRLEYVRSRRNVGVCM